MTALSNHLASGTFNVERSNQFGLDAICLWNFQDARKAQIDLDSLVEVLRFKKSSNQTEVEAFSRWKFQKNSNRFGLEAKHVRFKMQGKLQSIWTYASFQMQGKLQSGLSAASLLGNGRRRKPWSPWRRRRNAAWRASRTPRARPTSSPRTPGRAWRRTCGHGSSACRVHWQSRRRILGRRARRPATGRAD